MPMASRSWRKIVAGAVTSILAAHVLFALPPRLLERSIAFTPRWRLTTRALAGDADLDAAARQIPGLL